MSADPPRVPPGLEAAVTILRGEREMHERNARHHAKTADRARADHDAAVVDEAGAHACAQSCTDALVALGAEDLGDHEAERATARVDARG